MNGSRIALGAGTGELAGQRLSDCDITGIDQSVNMLKEDKTKIAYQLGYSETSFLSRSEQVDYKLE